MTVIFRLPVLVLGLRRERRSAELASLHLARATSTLRSDYRGMWRRTLGSPKGLLVSAGLGLLVGLLGRLPAQRARLGLFGAAALVAQGMTAVLRRHDDSRRPAR